MKVAHLSEELLQNSFKVFLNLIDCVIDKVLQ